MSRDFVYVSPQTSIIECAKLMAKKRVGSVVLQENNILKGLITEKDIVWVLTKRNFKNFLNTRAGDLAKKKVVTIRPSADLEEAIRKMNKSKHRWIPVVDKNEVIGFLTLKDIIKIEPALFDILKENYSLDEKFDPSGKEGLCEQCGEFSKLKKTDERLICNNCKDKM